METNTNIAKISVSQMAEYLSNAYTNLILANKPLQRFPSVMLWGAPGVGKSQGVRQIATKIEEKTNKKVAITDVRLLLFNPVDLRGIPTANAEKTLAVWLKPQIFQMDDSEDVINILFLDEISAAPQSVQAAAYQITLDRKVGEHMLPDNCIVMAAGNRVTDKSVAYNMPKALSNRLCHFEIKGDADSWHKWAVKTGIHEYILGYLEYNSVALMRFDSTGTDLAFATPRSWEMASNIFNDISSDMNEVYPMIIGCIGRDTASSLKSWVELYDDLPSMEKLFSGEPVRILNNTEYLIALRSAMVSYARKNPEKEKIDNSIEFACTLPWAFRRKLMRDYYCIADVRPIIKENEVFKTALRNNWQ